MISAAYELVRGIAAPIGISTMLAPGNVVERILPGAFRKCATRIPLIWGSHYGDQIGVTEFAFESPAGLAFEARLAPQFFGLKSLIRTGAVQCSVLFGHMQCLRNSDGARVIQQAEINHVAFVEDPAYQGTGVWLASDEIAQRARQRDLRKYRRLVYAWHAGLPRTAHSIRMGR